MALRRSPGRTAEEALDGLRMHLDPRDIAAGLDIRLESVGKALDRAGKHKQAQIFYEADAKDRQRLREALGRAA